MLGMVLPTLLFFPIVSVTHSSPFLVGHRSAFAPPFGRRVWEDTPCNINPFCLLFLCVVWRGQFTARRDLCVTHGVTFRPGDFLCVRVSRAAESTEDECRILHCRVTDVQGANAPTAPVCVTFIHCVTEKGCDPPESLLRAGNTCMEVITQSLPYRRMITAVNRLGDASELARSVVLRRDVPAYTARNPHVPDPSAVQLVDGLELNEGQLEAVRKAVTSPLSLIQGPPG